jgi:hypothetical protein
LEIQGFVPEYLWSVDILPHGTNTLPPFRMVTGASVTGFVRTDDDKPTKDAIVEILTPSGDRIAAPARERPESGGKERGPSMSYSLHGQTNNRGFFQLRGLPTGEFQLMAQKGPLSGLTSARLEGDHETRLRDFLVLEQPLQLAVSVEPAVAPSGTPWTLRVVRLEPRTSELYRRQAAMDGRFVVSPLTRGLYSLEAWSDGARWFVESVAIDGPPAPVVIRLPVVTVRGKLSLGRKPLQARLIFGGIGGPVGIPIETNEEGSFEGSLPRDGDWVVSVEAREPAVHRKLARVPVEANAAGVARADIDLPDGVVSGRVVDESGAGVRALLDVMPAGQDDHNVQVRVEANGAFSVHGLPEGDMALEAQAEGGRRSDIERVTVVEGKPAQATLVVRGAKPVRGQLRSTEGAPIAGGTLLALEADGRSGSPFYRTDAEGWFTLQLRPGTREVTLIYWADGHALRFARTEVPDNPIALTLMPVGGSLVLDLGRELEVWNGAEPYQVVVRSNGAQVPLSGLFSLTLRRGVSSATPATRLARTVELPLLNPGTYAACVQDRAGAIAGRPPQGPCVEGTLGPGGSLRLSLPPESWPMIPKPEPTAPGQHTMNDD